MSLIVSHHLLLCATSTKNLCCDFEIGNESWEKLKQVVKELGLENINRPGGIVMRSKVDCLRICKNGPILLIWPDGVWYGNITPEKIEVIVKEHLVKGNLLDEWIIKRTDKLLGCLN